MSFLICALAVLFTIQAGAAGVKVLFDPSRPEIGPYPTDYLTAPATNTKTGRRVRLPQPADCTPQPNACQEAWLLSDFDGFSLRARVRVRFSAAVNPDTLQAGVHLVARENLTLDEPGLHKPGDVIRLNQIVWDPATNTAYGKPDAAMDQHRRYAILVTDAVKDTSGDPVEPDEAFAACAGASPPDDYCKSVAEAAKSLGEGVKIAAASLYTTMSATAWIEKARDQLANTSATAFFEPGRRFFRIGDLLGVIWRQQTRVRGDLENFTFPVNLLSNVSAFAFGAYASPNFIEAGSIPARPSAEQLPLPGASTNVQFHAFLPRAEKPAAGYPVVIFGHGYRDSRFGAPSLVATSFGGRGMATIAISAVGHGFGPTGTLQVRTQTAGTVEVAAGGRGVDLNGDGVFEPGEGCAAVVSSPLGLRDCIRQTVVDLMQLVRVIRSGLDIDGDGAPDFDPNRIYYAGQSLGAIYGAILMAVEPNIQSAVLNSGGGSIVDIGRWSQTYRAETAQHLALRRPSLRNAGASFDDDFPLRNQPPRVSQTPGALDVQEALETLEWLQTEGDPASYVAHLKLTPLAGVPAKKILWQYALGDKTVPNPAATYLVRAAGMTDSVWIYRHDLTRQSAPSLDADPHAYLTTFSPAALQLATATQAQMAAFLATGDGGNPNLGLFFYPPNTFEQPTALPEEFNFLEP